MLQQFQRKFFVVVVVVCLFVNLFVCLFCFVFVLFCFSCDIIDYIHNYLYIKD